MRNHETLALILCMSALLSTGCKSTSTTADNAAQLHDIWVLTELNGRAITVEDVTRELPTLELNTTTMRVAGNTSCNAYSGPFETSGNRLKFGNLVSTRMACPKSVETEFLAMLQSVTEFKREGLALMLLEAGNVKAKFKKVD